MRYRDFKFETLLFQKSSDKKYYDVINDLINSGYTFNLGPEGQNGTFVIDKGQEIYSNTQTLNGKGYQLNQANEKVSINQIKANQLHRSSEIIALAGGRARTADKEKLQLKPSHIFPDGRFPASEVFDAVINNSVLKNTDYGQMVIEIAKQIQLGQNPDMSQIPKQFVEGIRDYAGEYLGVLALLKGTANFPTRDKWLEHLGVTSLDNIELFFPAKSNNPLADSIGYFQNKKTGNSILVSSKGAKGAAPSIDGLKIPVELDRSNSYASVIGFIRTLQQKGSAFTQPFYDLNYIHEIDPEKIHVSFRDILPVTEDEMESLFNYFKSGITLSDVKLLPTKFRNFIKNYNFKSTHPVAGVIQYYFKQEIKTLVNNENVFPEFEPLAREILQKNFIQIFANVKNNKLIFDVVWPNKEMATGKITIETKYGANQAAQGKMSFNVANTTGT
jgi:hypothetical protein